jgi:hypothetical protein
MRASIDPFAKAVGAFRRGIGPGKAARGKAKRERLRADCVAELRFGICIGHRQTMKARPFWCKSV